MVKAFVKAARLRTLPLAMASIATGSVMAAYFYEHSWPVTILALLTAILLQILSNFANDYGDFTKGTDDDSRTDRALASGEITIAQMRSALIVFTLLSLLAGIALLRVSLEEISTSFLIFFILGLAAIGAAIKYTAGKKPYGYYSLGDFAVLMFFGWVAVLGIYYLHTQHTDRDFMLGILPSTAIGLLSVGVLNVNNIRDIEGDTENGKKTLASVLGKSGAEWYQLVLYVISLALIVTFINRATQSNGLLIILVSPLYLIHWLKLRSLENTGANRPKYNRLLKLHVFMNLLVVLLFALILLL